MFKHNVPTVDADQLLARVRQEIEAAQSRPRLMEPQPPPPLRHEGAIAPSGHRLLRLKIWLRGVPLVGDFLAAVNRACRHTGMRERLRALPLLGPALAWANGARTIADTRRRLAILEAEVHSTGQRFNNFAGRLEDAIDKKRFEHFAARLEDALDKNSSRLETIVGRLDSHDLQSADLKDRLADQHMANVKIANDLAATRAEWESTAANLTAELGAMRQAVDVLRHEDGRLRTEILFQQRRLARTLEASPVETGPSLGQERQQPSGTSHALDAYYSLFEERFRGSRADILDRLSVYIDAVNLVGVQAIAKPVLDLGCGRGEWLELLAGKGLTAYGVDTNTLNVMFCRQSGLDVREEDVLAHLHALSDHSIGAITAFHLIEHLPFDVLVALLDEANRVLASGGLLVMETPNPENILVGACTFYNDPTHRNPLPPALTSFLVEQRGFVEVEVRRLHPYPESHWINESSATAERVNSLFYGPQDYAILARKL